MKSSDEVRGVFEKALAIVDEREEMYGDAWKRGGLDTCLPQVFRKADKLRVQHMNGLTNTDKFRKGVLNLINWCAFTYYHLEERND